LDIIARWDLQVKLDIERLVKMRAHRGLRHAWGYKVANPPTPHNLTLTSSFTTPSLCFPPCCCCSCELCATWHHTLMQEWVWNGRAGSWAAHQDNRKGYRQASRCCQSQARSEEGCKEEIKTQEDARIGSNASARPHYLQFLFPERQQRVCHEIPLIILDFC
jgi:hypothetical protein